jgi:uncharacterized peroxidase-related enzyme
MPRINPLNPDVATEESKQLFGQVQKKLGRVPNLMQSLGHSPAALGGFLSLNESLSRGVLHAKDRERIALTVAEYHGCGYCAAAHSAIGNMVGLTENQIHEARRGSSDDPNVESLLRFVHQVLDSKGHVEDSDLDSFRSAGYSDAAIAEVVAHVSLNVLTNFFNSVAEPEVDFPQVEVLAS